MFRRDVNVLDRTFASYMGSPWFKSGPEHRLSADYFCGSSQSLQGNAEVAN